MKARLYEDLGWVWGEPSVVYESYDGGRRGGVATKTLRYKVTIVELGAPNSDGVRAMLETAEPPQDFECANNGLDSPFVLVDREIYARVWEAGNSRRPEANKAGEYEEKMARRFMSENNIK